MVERRQQKLSTTIPSGRLRRDGGRRGGGFALGWSFGVWSLDQEFGRGVAGDAVYHLLLSMYLTPVPVGSSVIGFRVG
jgi:hypothetical protein